MELVKHLASERAMVAFASKCRITILNIHVQICPLSECEAHSGIAASRSLPLGMDFRLDVFRKLRSVSRRMLLLSTSTGNIELGWV